MDGIANGKARGGKKRKMGYEVRAWERVRGEQRKGDRRRKNNDFFRPPLLENPRSAPAVVKIS